jgi:hypothetical protein
LPGLEPGAIMLHPLIAGHLTEDDDPTLWDAATTALLAGGGASAAGARQEVYARVGCCHHWISPHHPIRWAAGGGFAWPFGYVNPQGVSHAIQVAWRNRATSERAILCWTGLTNLSSASPSDGTHSSSGRTCHFVGRFRSE